jgi:hypothetical protein
VGDISEEQSGHGQDRSIRLAINQSLVPHLEVAPRCNLSSSKLPVPRSQKAFLMKERNKHSSGDTMEAEPRPSAF